jgi:hypothetical protein
VVDPLELLDDAVEPLEKRVDLAISQIPTVHKAIVRREDADTLSHGGTTTAWAQSARRTS